MSKTVEIRPTEAQLRIVYSLVRGQVLSTEDAEYWGLTKVQWASLQRFADLCETALDVPKGAQ